MAPHTTALNVMQPAKAGSSDAANGTVRIVTLRKINLWNGLAADLHRTREEGDDSAARHPKKVRVLLVGAGNQDAV